ncbi:MAG TPA: hypothetical protein VM008_10070 [Phycisphaerae bacterium]|nr:hypothetical protein [Phycisphaerae bacterium]
MIHGYHVVLGAYGFWLPNDPRGSWSTYVGSRKLYQFGAATKTSARRSVAHREHDVGWRMEAKTALKRPAVKFNGIQARAIGRGFWEFMRRNALTCWACAVMPEHVHLVLGRHEYLVEQMANLLKGAGTRALLAESLHPFADQRDGKGKLPHCWGEGGWYVYLDDERDIRRAISYVEGNPEKDGLPQQRWSFVEHFEGLRRAGEEGERPFSIERGSARLRLAAKHLFSGHCKNAEGGRASMLLKARPPG